MLLIKVIKMVSVNSLTFMVFLKPSSLQLTDSFWNWTRAKMSSVNWLTGNSWKRSGDTHSVMDFGHRLNQITKQAFTSLQTLAVRSLTSAGSCILRGLAHILNQVHTNICAFICRGLFSSWLVLLFLQIGAFQKLQAPA